MRSVRNWWVLMDRRFRGSSRAQWLSSRHSLVWSNPTEYSNEPHSDTADLFDYLNGPFDCVARTDVALHPFAVNEWKYYWRWSEVVSDTDAFFPPPQILVARAWAVAVFPYLRLFLRSRWQLSISVSYSGFVCRCHVILRPELCVLEPHPKITTENSPISDLILH